MIFQIRNYCSKLLLILGIVASIAGCVHEPVTLNYDDATTKTTDQNPTGETPVGCDPDTVWFENDILPMLLSSCAKSGCHDAATTQDGVRLDNYFNIMNTGDVKPFRPDDSDIYEAITDSDPEDRMPPMGNNPLTTDQIELMRKWILQGALNNRCDDGCDTVNVTFSGNIQPLLNQKCVNCHSGNTPQGDVRLLTYDEVYTKVADGRLTGAVNHQPGFTAMPYGGNKLPECELRQIQIWINNGAKND